MLTVPLFPLLAALTAVLVKTRSVSSGPVVLGVALGLTLASTAVGPPVIDAMTTATASAVQTITASMGGTK